MRYYQHLKRHILHTRFQRSFIIAAALFIVAIVLNYFASTYATESASSSVTDIVLSNIPVFNVGGIFALSTFAFIAVIVVVAFQEPKRMPFIMEAVALFLAIRSVFLTLTHIAPFPTQAPITSTIFERFNFGGDLFFSGHTGIPFLLALIFWDINALRNLFLFLSVFFAIIVLLGHIHYSIDVLSAYFITYTIYHIATRLFTNDAKFLKHGLPNE